MLDVGVIRLHLVICLFLSPPHLLVVITNCPICHFCYAHKVDKNVKAWGGGGGAEWIHDKGLRMGPASL